jgi:hypothetical protein
MLEIPEPLMALRAQSRSGGGRSAAGSNGPAAAMPKQQDTPDFFHRAAMAKLQRLIPLRGTQPRSNRAPVLLRPKVSGSIFV